MPICRQLRLPGKKPLTSLLPLSISKKPCRSDTLLEFEVQPLEAMLAPAAAAFMLKHKSGSACTTAAIQAGLRAQLLQQSLRQNLHAALHHSSATCLGTYAFLAWLVVTCIAVLHLALLWSSLLPPPIPLAPLLFPRPFPLTISPAPSPAVSPAVSVQPLPHVLSCSSEQALY